MSNVASEVVQRLPPGLSAMTNASGNVPRNLDVTYITDRLLVTSKPAEAPVPTRNDVGRDKDHRVNTTAQPSLTADMVVETETEQKVPSDDAQGPPEDDQHDQPHQPQHASARRKTGVNPGTLSTFLTKRHGSHFLALNLSEEDPDDRTLLLLSRQILQCRWSSPCIHKSETPCLPHILDICYAMHAFLSLDTRNVICVYCANGRTRTAIVLACYLKFSRVVRTALDGFRLFLSKRCPHLDPSATVNNIPPSLTTFFRNFDDCLELGMVLNPKPLLLRAITVQGVPVDDKPCIDIWDSQQRHVYSSHTDDPTLSQWADEEGFYRVGQVLEGDFVVLCRFGGPYVDETNDASKVLFRYANTTGFLASGPYELPKSRVDMMRRYAQSFDDEDFSLTLVMESYWDCTDEDHKQELERNCDSKIMPPILEGRDAMEKGWHLVTERHAARPTEQDVDALMRAFCELQECPRHMCTLALQLTNFDLDAARDMLYVGSMKSWWRDRPVRLLQDVKDEKNEEVPRVVTPVPDQACLDILRILDEVQGKIPVTPQQDDGNRNIDKPAQDEDPLFLYEPALFPNRGDIVDSFGEYYKQMSLRDGRPQHDRHHPPLEMGCKPLMPIVSRKRVRLDEAATSQKRPNVDPFQHIGQFSTPQGAHGDMVHDEDFMAAMEVSLQIRHTGVTLQDLRRLQVSSRSWNKPQQSSADQDSAEEKGENLPQSPIAENSEQDASADEVTKEGDEKDSGTKDDGKESETEKPAGEVEDVPLNKDPEYEKVRLFLALRLKKHI